jgi:hypothetical protein
VKVKELREVLAVLERHRQQDGRPQEAEALSAFAANLLRGDDDESVAALVKRIEKARRVGRSKARAVPTAKSGQRRRASRAGA